MPIISIAKQWEEVGAGQWVGVAAVATYVRHTSDATRQIAQSGKLRATATAKESRRDERREGREKGGE